VVAGRFSPVAGDTDAMRVDVDGLEEHTAGFQLFNVAHGLCSQRMLFDGILSTELDFSFAVHSESGVHLCQGGFELLEFHVDSITALLLRVLFLAILFSTALVAVT
jgi:hypothetical protein